MIKKTDTERLICKTFLDLVQETPFDKIKVTELIRRAGISRSAFYSYFDSVYAVMEKIENDFMEGLEEPFQQDVRDRDRHSFTMLRLTYLQNNKQVIEVLVGPNGDPSFYHQLVTRTRKVIEERYSGPTGKTDVELKVFSEYLAGGIWAVTKWWIFHQNQASMEDICTQLEILTGQTGYQFTH